MVSISCDERLVQLLAENNLHKTKLLMKKGGNLSVEDV